MIKVIFTKGMQASGKSTWAKQFVKENQDYKRICRDDLRHMISSYTFNGENEKLVTAAERDLMHLLITEDYSLIIDKMNLNDRDLNATENANRE